MADRLPKYDMQVKAVTKSFGRFRALDEVTFEVLGGSTTLLLGPNGAGKTTLLRCIMGLLNFHGSITFGGIDVRSAGTKARSMIGYVPQQSAYYENLSVRAEANFMANLKHADGKRVDLLLKRFDLWDKRDQKIKSLSSGMRQRLGVVISQLSEPPLLIFDEPTSNLDVRNRTEFQTILNELSAEEKTVIIATHLSGLDKQADKVVVLDSGRVIADDTPSNLLNRIGTSSQITIRPKEKEFKNVLSVVESLGVKDLIPTAPWISFSVPGEGKPRIFKAIEDEGYVLDDMIVEPSSIESEYLKLIQRENPV